MASYFWSDQWQPWSSISHGTQHADCWQITDRRTCVKILFLHFFLLYDKFDVGSP